MNIAIIGSGNVGMALATRLAAAGHSVVMGVRNLAKFKNKEMLSSQGITHETIVNAIQPAAVIIITTPADAAVGLATQFGDLSNKIVIDTTNAIQKKPEPYATAFEAFKQMCKAKTVKCFNSTGFENMANPIYALEKPVHLDMFMAGSDLEAKKVAAQLAKDIGFENCYDFGGDDKVVLLEQFALAWINLAIMQGMGRNIAFKVIKR